MNSLYDQNTNFQIFCSLWNNMWRFELWHWCCTLQLHICKYVHSMSNLVLLHLNIISNHCCAETFIILWKSRHFSKQYTFLQCRFPPEKCVITWFLYTKLYILSYVICRFVFLKFYIYLQFAYLSTWDSVKYACIMIKLASWWFFLICYFIIINFFLNIFTFLKLNLL